MSKTTKITINIMLVTIISKIIGFVRELVLASYYGTSVYSDAYLVAYSIPGVLFAVVGTALSTTFIPLYYDANNIGGEDESFKFTNNIFNIVLILGVIVSILGFIFSKPLTKVFAIGFDDKSLNIATNFTKIMIFSTLFIGTSSIVTAFLQIKNKFTLAALVGIPFNIIIIIFIILSSKGNYYLMGWGTLIAMASKLIFQLPRAYKEGYRYKNYLRFNDRYIKKMIWLVGPVFIGVSVNQINTMIDRTLASTLTEGSISALNYSNRLNGFVMGLCITSIAAVIYPILSKLSSENNKEKFNEFVVKSINSVILLVIPITIGAIVLSTPIVKVLFERGEFDTRATQMTSDALVMYSLGLIGFGLRDILGKIFYSLQDTKTPMVNGAISMFFNIFLNLILVKFMNHLGLALATSISALVCIILLFRSLRKKIGDFGQDKIIKVSIKSLISSIIMGIISYLLYEMLNSILGIGFIKESIALFISIISGAIVYSILIILFNIEEVNIITNMIKNKFKLGNHITSIRKRDYNM